MLQTPPPFFSKITTNLFKHTFYPPTRSCDASPLPSSPKHTPSRNYDICEASNQPLKTWPVLVQRARKSLKLYSALLRPAPGFYTLTLFLSASAASAKIQLTLGKQINTPRTSEQVQFCKQTRCPALVFRSHVTDRRVNSGNVLWILRVPGWGDLPPLLHGGRHHRVMGYFKMLVIGSIVTTRSWDGRSLQCRPSGVCALWLPGNKLLSIVFDSNCCQVAELIRGTERFWSLLELRRITSALRR